MTENENQATTNQPTVDFSAEAIDAMVIQLDSAFSVAGDKMPDDVKDTGREFIAALNRWSDAKKIAAQV